MKPLQDVWCAGAQPPPEADRPIPADTSHSGALRGRW